MLIIPAIDLLDGRCVRLRHGDFNDCTKYQETPLNLAIEYADTGAQWLHVVDLAASRDGLAADTDPLFKLLDLCPQKVQTGGGVREADDVSRRLKNGADRVIIGTLCATRPETFIQWLDNFGTEKLVAGLDVTFDADGLPWPRSHGWTEGSDYNLWQLLDLYSNHGLKHLLCTDISRDGAMQGPNVGLYAEIVRRYPELQVQASGGVTQLSDLSALQDSGAHSSISGKALLEKSFLLEDALDLLA